MRRTSVIVLLAVTLVLGTAWYLALFRPIDVARVEAQRDETEAQVEFDTLSAQLTRLEGLDSNRATQDALTRRIDTAVPATPDLGPFIIEANTIATNAGISWISIEPGEAATPVAEDFTAIPVRIRVEGGFFTILDYMNRLETAARLVIVDSVVTAPLPVERTGGIVDLINPQLGATMHARIFTRAAPFVATGATVSTTTTSTTTTTTTSPVGGL